MNKDFDTLISKLSRDITNSLKTNLSIYVEKNEKANELLQQLKVLLFKLPEYVELQTKYNQLEQRYNELKDKHDPHILLDVSEVSTKSCETVNVSSDALNNVKVIELNYLKNNVINKTVNEEDADDDEDEEEEEEEDEVEEEEEEEVEEDEVEEEEEVSVSEANAKEEDEDEVEEEEVEEDEVSEAKEEVEAKAKKDEPEEEEEEAKEEEDEEEEDEEAKEEEDEEAKEEEEEELELLIIDKKKYYKNELNNDIYECLDDEEIGDLLGKLVNGKIRHL